MALEFNLQLPRRDFDLKLSGLFENGITGIYGPSGAGKSSFFHLLSGLEKPVQGFVKLNGKVLTDTEKGISVPVNKRRIGVVFQDRLLLPHLSVKKNLIFGVPYVKESKLSLHEVVDFLSLSSVLKSRPGEISGGEQQRVAIGRALMTSPEMLLLDEPFSAVDYTLRSTILPYIKGLKEVFPIPILVISHDRDDLEKLTDRICLISRGRERALGSMYEVASVKTG